MKRTRGKYESSYFADFRDNHANRLFKKGTNSSSYIKTQLKCEIKRITINQHMNKTHYQHTPTEQTQRVTKYFVIHV